MLDQLRFLRYPLRNGTGIDTCQHSLHCSQIVCGSIAWRCGACASAMIGFTHLQKGMESLGSTQRIESQQQLQQGCGAQ